MKTKRIDDFTINKVRGIVDKKLNHNFYSRINEIDRGQKIRLNRIAQLMSASIRETNLHVMNNFMVYVKYKEMFES